MTKTNDLPHAATEMLEEVRRRRAGLLLLDYDGTLAPFQEDRMKAVPYPGVEGLLHAAAKIPGNAMALISGRPVAEIEQLITIPQGAEVWGAHGWEVRRADGTLERIAPPTHVAQALDAAESIARGAGVREPAMERKIASVVIHERGLTTDAQRAAYQAARQGILAMTLTAGADVLAFDGGLELRCVSRTKADAVRACLAAHPECVGAACYLGDDMTDEDAFVEVNPAGLGILVRAESRATAARCRLVPPDQLLAFLRGWIDALEQQENPS